MRILNKHISIIILLCLVFFLLPHQGYSCVENSTKFTDQSCCDHVEHHQNESSKKDCSQDKNTGNSDCMSNCAKSCQTSSQPFSAKPSDEMTISFLQSAEKKSFPPYKQTHYSSGFHFIWQPPKIG